MHKIPVALVGFVWFSLMMSTSVWAVQSRAVAVLNQDAAVWNTQGTPTIFSVKDGRLRLLAPARMFLYRNVLALLDTPTTAIGAITLSVENHSDSQADFEVQWIEHKGAAKFWRRVKVPAKSKEVVTIASRWMRHGGKRTPRFDSIKYLGLFGRSALDVTVTDVVIQLSDTEHVTRLRLDELRQLAFLDGNKPFSKTSSRLNMLCEPVDGIAWEKLFTQLTTVDTYLQTLFPFALDTNHMIPTMVVFGGQTVYQDFVVKFAKQLNASAAKPRSGGYAFHTLATSYVKPEYGHQRPVFTHEFVHAWLETRLGMASGSGNWFQEGVANWVQLHYFPQANMKAIYRHGASHPSRRRSLSDILSGRRLALKEYWQSVTVVDWLHGELQGNWGPLVAYMHQHGSQGVLPWLSKTLKKDAEQLESDWLAHIEAMGKI